MNDFVNILWDFCLSTFWWKNKYNFLWAIAFPHETITLPVILGLDWTMRVCSKTLKQHTLGMRKPPNDALMHCLQSNELIFKKKGGVQSSTETFLILVLEVWKSVSSNVHFDCCCCFFKAGILVRTLSDKYLYLIKDNKC